MRQPGRREAIAHPGSPGAIRTVAIVLGGVSAALFVLVVVAFSRTGDLRGELAKARGDLARLSDRSESLKTKIVGMEGELHKLRLASADVAGLQRRVAELESRRSSPPDEEKIQAVVDAAFERRRARLAADMDRRGEQMMARFAERVDVEKLQKNIRGMAEAFRGEPRGEAAGKEGGDKPLPRETEKAIAKGLDGVAEGLDLWRQHREGKITREEFDRRRRELRDKFRKEFEGMMTPEQRERLQKRSKEEGGGEIF